MRMERLQQIVRHDTCTSSNKEVAEKGANLWHTYVVIVSDVTISEEDSVRELDAGGRGRDWAQNFDFYEYECSKIN